MLLQAPDESPYDIRFDLFGFSTRISWTFWLTAAVLGYSLCQFTDMSFAPNSPGAFALLFIWAGCMGLSILIHELGHAFGLPHPTDTEKYADAIMWLGIYGKYPDKTYLTDDDKKILRRSPFFYRENNEPVFKKGAVIASYNYSGGAFEQHAGNDPIDWTERKIDSDERHSFEETRRDKEFIYLIDNSR